MLRTLGFAILLTMSPAPRSEEAEPATSAEDSAIAAAKANRRKVKTPPAMISAGIDGMKAAVEAQRALGHHGEVVVVGILGADGRLRGAKIETGSRSQELDGLALEAARQSILSPAKDPTATPIPVWLSMPFSFKNRAFREGGGAHTYLCSEFTQDFGWWRAAWPDRPWSEHEFYKLMLGFGMLGILSEAKDDQAAIRRSVGDFELQWTSAIDGCPAKPNALVADFFGAAGRRAKSLSKLREKRR
jgi:TonB family protein